MRNKCKHTRQDILAYVPKQIVWCKDCGATRLDTFSELFGDYKRGKWESPKIITDGYLIVG